MDNSVINIRGHHLFTLHGLVSDSEDQLSVIVKHHGNRQAQTTQEVFRHLVADGLFVRIVAERDVFCLQCPTYDGDRCGSNEILTNDYLGARMFGLRIGEIYSGKQVLNAVTKTQLRVPCIIDKRPDFVLWLDYALHKPGDLDYNR
jgi:hypothetical protein